MTDFSVKSTTKVCNGNLYRFSHKSNETNTIMTVAVYVPKLDERSSIPCILYLSGLTCTDENVCQKSGVFKYLSDRKIAFIAPDTSPRGCNLPGDKENWDFGEGAGFYVDATELPWSSHYRMYSYITKELLNVVKTNYPIIDINRVGITGHSMGGHGALTIALKNRSLFKSVSAFAPICHPSVSPWGIKAFTGYLGSDISTWSNYDATQLITSPIYKSTSSTSNGHGTYDDILIDVGTDDSFYKNGQLLPEDFQKACETAGQHITIRYQDGYDHSYYFISTFIQDHIEFHAARL